MDRYKVVKRIGVGTYGSAYLVCLKAMPSTQYVLKKVKVEQLDDKERLQAEQEVKVLMQLAHPLVLRCVLTSVCARSIVHVCVSQMAVQASRHGPHQHSRAGAFVYLRPFGEVSSGSMPPHHCCTQLR